MTWTDRIETLLLRTVARMSDRAKVLLAVSLIVLGLVLGFLSLLPEIRVASTVSLGGTLGSFSELGEPVVPATGLSEIRLVNSSCAIVATALNAAQLQELNRTGNRPTPQLDCDHRIATFDDPLVWVILENRASSNETYDVEARFLRVVSPMGYLALIGFPLVLFGAMYLIVRSLRRGIEQLGQEFKTKNKKM